MERKLVSIQTIESIFPIEGADQIVAARVMGWNVVVKKGEFRPGDPCVFFEIDSVLPQGAPWAEYTGTRNRKEGIVVRPLVETPSATLSGRLSFKVINNDYLLKDED